MALNYGSMRYNGHLKALIVSEGEDSFNEYGEPISGEQESWGEEIPCSIKTNSDTRLGKYEDGEFRQASFLVLIELSKFDAVRIKLERLGEDLGERRVLSVEPLTTVGRIQIMV